GASGPGGGVARGGGPAGQQRGGKGRGRAPPGGGVWRGGGFKRAATAGAGPGWRSSFGPALPAGGGRVLYVGFSAGSGRCGAVCAPRRRPRLRVPASSRLRPGLALSLVTQSDQAATCGGWQKVHSALALIMLGFQASYFWTSGRLAP